MIEALIIIGVVTCIIINTLIFKVLIDINQSIINGNEIQEKIFKLVRYKRSQEVLKFLDKRSLH